MPEGDTIARAARALDRALAGREVTHFESVFPRLTRVHEDAPLTGRTVDGVRAAGKHLLMAFSGDLVLRTHLRMNGSWHLYRPGDAWRRPRSAMRIVVGTTAAVAVAFDLTVAELRTAAALARDPALRALGPDLLAPDFDTAAAALRLQAAGPRSIGAALLDQRLVAGVGNVLRSEICFVAGVHPDTPVASLDSRRLEAIVSVARRLLQVNVPPEGGWRSWRAAGRRTTGRMDPAAALWVYGRAGRPCRRCGTPIESGRRGEDARLAWWCPRCQPR